VGICVYSGTTFFSSLLTASTPLLPYWWTLDTFSECPFEFSRCLRSLLSYLQLWFEFLWLLPLLCHLPEMGKETGRNGRISVTIFIDTSPCNTPYLKCILLKTPQPNNVITQTVFFKIVMKLIATLWYKWICPIHNSCFSQVRTLTRRFYYWFNVFFKLVCYKMTDQ